MDKKFFQILKTIAVIFLIFPAANAVTCEEKAPDAGWPKGAKVCLTDVNQVGASSSIDEHICPSACEEMNLKYKKYWFIYLEPYNTIKKAGLYCACEK
jgi:hypothetical protein